MIKKCFILAAMMFISFSQLHAQDSLQASKWSAGKVNASDSSISFMVDTMIMHSISFIYSDSSKMIAEYNRDGDKKWVITDTMKLVNWFYREMAYQNKMIEWNQEKFDVLFKIWDAANKAAFGGKKESEKFNRLKNKLLNLQRHPPKQPS